MGNSDTIKLWFTYLTALLLIVGGLGFLYFSRLDPPESNTNSLIPLVAGFVGAAIQFLFNRETQTATARISERATVQGSTSTALATQAAATTAANVLANAGIANGSATPAPPAAEAAIDPEDV